MQYPVELVFKILAIAPQIWVRDATGQLLFYVKQKAFKLREAVTVFADEAQTRPVMSIAADRVFDISPTFTFADNQGRSFGTLKRKGLASIWKAHYEINTQSGAVLTVREENPVAKLLDGLLGEIPIINLLTGYILHPSYIVTRNDGAQLLRLKKQPAFLEGKFTITKLGDVPADQEAMAIVGLLMMVLMERSRG